MRVVLIWLLIIYFMVSVRIQAEYTTEDKCGEDEQKVRCKFFRWQ